MISSPGWGVGTTFFYVVLIYSESEDEDILSIFLNYYFLIIYNIYFLFYLKTIKMNF